MVALYAAKKGIVRFIENFPCGDAFSYPLHENIVIEIERVGSPVFTAGSARILSGPVNSPTHKVSARTSTALLETAKMLIKG